MVPRHRRQSRNSSAKTKFFKSPRRTLSEYPCGGLARTLFSAFRRRKFRQSAADPIGSAAEQICSAAVRRVRGGFRGGIFCSAAKLNLADSAGVRRGPARTQADPGGVRGGIVPPWELPPDPRRTTAELIYSAESAADSASEIFIPPKKFFVGFRLGGDRTNSDPLGLNRSPPRNCSATYITAC